MLIFCQLIILTISFHLVDKYLFHLSLILKSIYFQACKVVLISEQFSPIKVILLYFMFSAAYSRISLPQTSMSSTNVTLEVRYQDSFAKAVAKNVIVLLLGISINYINGSLIHTFSKHEVWYTFNQNLLWLFWPSRNLLLNFLFFLETHHPTSSDLYSVD